MIAKKPTNFAYYLTRYLTDYLPCRKNMSHNTILSYRDTFVLLLKFTCELKQLPVEKLCIEDVSKEFVENFLNWLESRKNSISTQNQRLAAIHAFFRYLQIEVPQYLFTYQSIMTIPFKKKIKPTVNYLTVEGIRKILALPDLSLKNGRRDLVILSLLYDTAARVQEIADLTVKDLRLKECAYVKLTGKGSKSRHVPLMADTVNLIKSYLIEHKLVSSEKNDCLLFSNHSGKKLTRAGISYILAKYVIQVAYSSPELIPDPVSVHCIRHSKAMHLLQAGVNIVYIRDFLGHASVKTTEVYARADEKMKRLALEKAYKHTTPSDLPSWNENANLISFLNSLGKV